MHGSSRMATPAYSTNHFRSPRHMLPRARRWVYGSAAPCRITLATRPPSTAPRANTVALDRQETTEAYLSFTGPDRVRYPERHPDQTTSRISPQVHGHRFPVAQSAGATSLAEIENVRPLADRLPLCFLLHDSRATHRSARKNSSSWMT